MGHGRRRWRVIWAAGTVALAVVVTAGVAAGDMHGGLPARVLSGHGMGGAVAFAVDGGHVWAIRDAAHGAGSVLELNASNGSWVRTLSNAGWPRSLLHGCLFGALSAGRYRFSNPSVIAAVGSHISIPDGRSSVTVVSDR